MDAIRIDAEDGQLVVTESDTGEELLRESFPQLPTHVRRRSEKGRGEWLAMYALKALGAHDARDPREAGE